MDIHPLQDTDAPFDPFAAQPPEVDPVDPPIQEAIPIAEAVTETEDANIGGMPLHVSNYGEAQHRIQLSDQVHVDIPDDMLNDAQAHLWKNGFPNMNRTDTIAALLRSGAVTQGTPIEGGNDFYREHGVIPNAQAADALRGYFQGATPNMDPRDEACPRAATEGLPDPFSVLRDQHDLDRDASPNPGDLMQILVRPDESPSGGPLDATTPSGKENGSLAARPDTGTSDTGTPGHRDTGTSAIPSDQKPSQARGSETAGRGFAWPGLPGFGLRSFMESRAEHSRSRRVADLENTRLDMAMEAASTALKGVDPYLPSSSIPDGDRALLYADRLKKDPEAHDAHYEMIGKFSRLRDTVEQWTDAAKDNPALQKEAGKKLKAVDDLLKSGEVVPDATFKESLDKIARAISEMFSRIFQRLGLSTGKSAEAGM